jgi:hypothetical protein
MRIFGLDFTSAPRSTKPITCAHCNLNGDILQLETFETFRSFDSFEAFLARPGPWVAGLDFPFGQPRRLIENIGWPTSWEGYIRMLAGISKDKFRETLEEYCESRPTGDKQHLRQVDKLANSRSPMMLFGVPVGKMFFEGAHRLLNSGACILPCHPNDSTRIILEAYPALVARRWIGNHSYKTDEVKKQTAARKAARAQVIAGIGSTDCKQYFGLGLDYSEKWADQFIRDGSGDQLDALLCAIQAGWAYTQRDQGHGIPARCDPLEGWIVDPLLLNDSIRH